VDSIKGWFGRGDEANQPPSEKRIPLKVKGYNSAPIDCTQIQELKAEYSSHQLATRLTFSSILQSLKRDNRSFWKLMTSSSVELPFIDLSMMEDKNQDNHYETTDDLLNDIHRIQDYAINAKDEEMVKKVFLH
jgi:hypothetical protein